MTRADKLILFAGLGLAAVGAMVWALGPDRDHLHGCIGPTVSGLVSGPRGDEVVVTVTKY
jgi:hypothetical protein